MTFDHELALINQPIKSDEIGNQVPFDEECYVLPSFCLPIRTETIVLCGRKSVSRSEFYNAAANGLKPEIVFIVHPYEYSGEPRVRFEDVEYNVIKTYLVNDEELELTCERVLAHD